MGENARKVILRGVRGYVLSRRSYSMFPNGLGFNCDVFARSGRIWRFFKCLRSYITSKCSQRAVYEIRKSSVVLLRV